MANQIAGFPLEKAKSFIIQCVTAFIENQNLEFSQNYIKIETPPDSSLGNIALACFPFAKALRKAPPVIASELQQHFSDTEKSPFSKIEQKGPYLNFFYSKDFLNAALKEAFQNANFGSSNFGEEKEVMIEFSSPNTNKPLHLGHGRNNVLGMTLANLFQKVGYKVIKTNLVNDRGVHICKSMLAYQRFGDSETPQSEEIKGDKFVGNYYVLFDQKAKQDESLNDQAQLMLKDWEAEDESIRALWKQMNQWVLDGFQETYQRMGIDFDRYYFESETYLGGKEVVQEALQKGICKLEDNGAISIDLEQYKLGKKILLRGDGTSVYITQDINTTIQKFKDYSLNQCLFVVGNEQDNHFKVLFHTLKEFGYEWSDFCEHISYGMILLPEGKMKSREGTVVDLDDLMNELRDLALQGFEERSNDNVNLSEEEKRSISEAVGQAALKYYILKTNASKNMTFDPKESLSFEGDTGPYLQYTHARICTMLRKAELVIQFEENTFDWNESEMDLLSHILVFPNIILNSVQERNPSILAGYAYNLSKKFNKYYYDYKILKAETKDLVNQRLLISNAVKNILKSSLELFGIQALEKM